MVIYRDIRATIAPFYDTTAKEFARMSPEKRETVRDNFFHSARILAELLEIPFNPDMTVQNIGGFVNELDNKLVEISHTFSFKGIDKDTIDLFAALMAEFGYQGQESVISVRYCKETAPEHNGQEYKIFVSRLNYLAKICQECGINEYTINTKEKSIAIYLGNYLTQEEEAEIRENIKNLKNNLINYGYFKKNQERPVVSSYLDRNERTNLYQSWLQDREGVPVLAVGTTEGGLYPMGVSQPRYDRLGLFKSARRGSGAPAYRNSGTGRRQYYLCCAIREAYRRLTKQDYHIGKTDSFLRDIESEMRQEESRLLAEESTPYGNNPEKYKNKVLSDICEKFNKTFANGPFRGVNIEFNWQGTIISFTFKNNKDKVITWSLSDGTLDNKGNHITKTGATYNIFTGEYRQASKKIEKEWKQSKRALKRPKGIHR